MCRIISSRCLKNGSHCFLKVEYEYSNNILVWIQLKQLVQVLLAWACASYGNTWLYLTASKDAIATAFRSMSEHYTVRVQKCSETFSSHIVPCVFKLAPGICDDLRGLLAAWSHLARILDNLLLATYHFVPYHIIRYILPNSLP